MSGFGEILGMLHLHDIFIISHLGDILDISEVRGHLVTSRTFRHRCVDEISASEVLSHLTNLEDG